MLFSEGTGRKVVSTSSANTVGYVKGFVIDPSTSSVVALSLTKTTGNGTHVPWSAIGAFGADAVTVGADDAVVAADEHIAELDGKHRVVIGKRVLTTAGLQIGTVRDVDFDPSNGRVLALLLEEQPVEGERLLGIGSYATVVRA